MLTPYDIHWFSRPAEVELTAAPALTLGAPLGMPTPRNAERQRDVRPPNGHPAENPRRLFDRSIGFWLGGALLGIGGCILGGFMPYSHPVAVTISVLWWGIYLGCLGASIGAFAGLLARTAPYLSIPRVANQRWTFSKRDSTGDRT
jgi:hypothetical protein